MATHNNKLWQTVVFLFLSKLSLQQGQPFKQKLLINAKNIALAQRFAAMTNNTTEDGKVKLALLKALKQLEKKGWVQRIDTENIQLSAEGISMMNAELHTAMQKIATSFPETAANKPKQSTIN